MVSCAVPVSVRRGLLGLLALVALAGCREEQLAEPLPEPPDMGTLVGAYATPTAALTAENVLRAWSGATDSLGVSERLGNLTFLLEDVLGTAFAAEDEEQQALTLSSHAVSRREDALSLEGTGFLRIERICPGWDAAGTVDVATNGAARLTALFTERGLDPVVWGDLASCRWPIGERRLHLDGALEVFVGNSVQLDSFGASPIILAFRGAATVDDELLQAAGLDLRWLPDAGGLELRIPVGEEHLVFFRSAVAQGFRAADGVWTCVFEEQRCERDDGTVIQW